MLLTFSHTLSNSYFSFLFCRDIHTPKKYSFSAKVNFSIVSMFNTLQIIVSEKDLVPVYPDKDKFEGFSSMFKFEIDKIGKSYVSTKITINL
jgi:hypothetical protein